MSELKSRFRLLVVDDHTLFRRGLTALLGLDARFQVVGEAGDAGEALRAAEREQPDIILLDNHLPGVLGVDTIGALKEAAPQARVLMLTVSEDEADLAAALTAGADGYLLKTINSDDLGDSIVRVCQGGSVVSPEMTSKLVAAFKLQQQPVQAASPAPHAPVAPAGPVPVSNAVAAAPRRAATAAGAELLLSPREREILTLIARGASNKHIARDLGIAETTVKIHVQHILRKLQLSSRVQAAVYAVEHGMV